jgi:dienelactone hydrolase
MKTRLLLIALSLLVLASFADAQTATTVAASRLPPTAEYSGFGPFKTSSENNTGPDGTYTIVRPETLGKDGFLHAPIIFGPGIGGSVESMMNLLQRIASHGFVIIGRRLDAGPGNPENNRRMIAGLDWLIKQNTTAGSMFEGKLDVEHAASMGYSVGGTGAVDIGGHKAITTVVSIHGHSAKAELHGTLLLMGGSNDVMRDGQSWLAPTYEASQVQTFFSLVDGANHGYPARTVDGVQSGVEAPAMIAWLRYWIYNDQDAKRYFFGDDCVMCNSPWTNTQRKEWPSNGN